VLTAASVRAVFGLACEVIADPLSGKPLVLPIGRHRMRG
jgi:iron complex transport system ATP-binding protein